MCSRFHLVLCSNLCFQESYLHCHIELHVAWLESTDWIFSFPGIQWMCFSLPSTSLLTRCRRGLAYSHLTTAFQSHCQQYAIYICYFLYIFTYYLLYIIIYYLLYIIICYLLYIIIMALWTFSNYFWNIVIGKFLGLMIKLETKESWLSWYM